MKLLTIKQVAERLNVNYYTVYGWIYAGHMPHKRIGPTGRTIRISEQDLEDYLSKMSASSASRPGKM